MRKREYNFLLAVFLTFVVLFAGCSSTPQKRYAEFSIENWEDTTHVSYRYDMAKDLVAKEILLGKTRDEVIATLGNIGRISEKSHDNIALTLRNLRRLEGDSFDGIVYIVGYNTIDTIILIIQFDDDGYVSSTFIYEG